MRKFFERETNKGLLVGREVLAGRKGLVGNEVIIMKDLHVGKKANGGRD